MTKASGMTPKFLAWTTKSGRARLGVKGVTNSALDLPEFKGPAGHSPSEA